MPSRVKASAVPTPARPQSPTTGAAEAPLTLGLHMSLDLLVEHDYPRGEWVEPEDWPETLARNLDWIVSAGYDTILLDVIDPEGYLFSSDVLAEQGYNAFPDLLAPFMTAAHARGLTIFADITILAWRLDPDNQAIYRIQGEPLSVGQVQQVVATLLDDYGVDGIVEETFTSEYIAGIHQVARSRGRPYIHKWDDPVGAYDTLMSEDYVGYLDSVAERERLEPIGAAANNLGVMNALFTHGRALGVPTWVKVYGGWGFSPGASQNVFLLRAVQFQADGYFWMSFGEAPNDDWVRGMDTGRLRQWLNRFRTPPTAPRPIANVYVVQPETTTSPDVAGVIELALIHTFGPLSNGLMLAGYDVRTSYDHPLPEAALTVLLVPGGWWDGMVDLPDEALDILRSDSPAIVVPALGLPGEGRWREALPLLGISPDWEPDYADEAMPETVPFAGQTVRWQGFGIWGYSPITSLISPEDVTGEVLVRSQVEGQETALLIRNGNKTFINGNLLNLDTSFVIARLASLPPPQSGEGRGGGLLAPFYGYGILGTRSAFMAMGDTQLQVSLR
ncbi:MAG: hypothetical protein ACE5H9_18225, partial [Anaerolineae bacterium]